LLVQLYRLATRRRNDHRRRRRRPRSTCIDGGRQSVGVGSTAAWRDCSPDQPSQSRGDATICDRTKPTRSESRPIIASGSWGLTARHAINRKLLKCRATKGRPAHRRILTAVNAPDHRFLLSQFITTDFGNSYYFPFYTGSIMCMRNFNNYT